MAHERASDAGEPEGGGEDFPDGASGDVFRLDNLYDPTHLGRNMYTQWWWQALERASQPSPCDLCHAPVPRYQLRQIWMPLVVLASWGELTPDKAQWVCPRCPG